MKENRLKAYWLKAMRLMGMFEEVRIDHVSRSKKSNADSLATIASKIKMNDTKMEKDIKVVKRTIPTSFLDVNLIEIAEVHVSRRAEENVDSTEGPKWFEPMWDYLAKGVLPQDKNEARNIIRQAHRYAILANSPYSNSRRSFLGVLMRCVTKRQGEKIMREVHGGDCGEDQSQGRLTDKENVKLC